MKNLKSLVHALTSASATLTAAQAIPGRTGVYATAGLAVVSGLLHLISRIVPADAPK